MVCSLRFAEAGVHFTSRYVRTPKICAEDSAGCFLFRGFGTRFPGDRLRRDVMLESPVNVSVYPFAGTLLAFGEQSLPMELDRDTLETRGWYDFQGSVNEVTPFAAHPKFDPDTGHLLNFGISYSANRPVLNLFEFQRDGNQLHRHRLPLDHAYANHDFGITGSHAVFFLSPLLMSFERFVKEGASIMESLDWKSDLPSNIFVVPRQGKSNQAFAVSAGHGYCLHFINCFEQGTTLCVDVLELSAPLYGEYQPLPSLFFNVPVGRPVRYTIDLTHQELVDRVELSYDRSPDFASVDPCRSGRPYEDFWMLGISTCGQAGSKFFDQLVHASWRTTPEDVFQLPPGEYFCAEPICVAHQANRDAAVVIVEHFRPKDDEAAFLIFDAFAVEQGPLARLPLRSRLHPGFHASFWAT